MYLLNNLIIGLLIKEVWGQTVMAPSDPSVEIDPAPPTVVGQSEQPSSPPISEVPTVPEAPIAPELPTEPTVPEISTAPKAPTDPTVPEVSTAPEASTIPTLPTEPSDGIQSNTATEPVEPTASTDSPEPTEPPASNEATQPTGPIEPTSLTEPTDLIEPTLPAAPTEVTEPTEPILIPPVEPTEPTAQNEPTEPTVIVESIEQSGAVGPTASEPSAPTQPNASAETVSPSEPTEPVEPTDVVEPTDAEATQQSDTPEAAAPTETTQPAPAEPTEPTAQAEPTEPPESAEQPEVTAPSAQTGKAPDVSSGPKQSGEGSTAGPANTQVPEIGTNEPVDQPTITSGFTTLTTPPPEPTGDVAELDLGDASLYPNARFTTVAGDEAIVLEPPPNGEATFSIKVEEPLDIEEGNFVELEAVVQVVESSSNRRKRFLIGRQDRGNRLQMIMNEKVIYDKEVDETAGKFQRIRSEKTQFVKNPVVQVLQTSGDNPVALSVSGLGFVKSETPTKEPKRPIDIPNTDPNPGSQETEEPAKEPPAPLEATGEEPPPVVQETDKPAPEPAAPPEVSVEEPPIVGEETTVLPPQQTGPPDVVQTEPVPGTLEIPAPSGPARSDGGTIITKQRPETGTSFAPVIGTGNPTETFPTTPTGPVDVRLNEAAHGIVTNIVVLYGVPVLAALLV